MSKSFHLLFLALIFSSFNSVICTYDDEAYDEITSGEKFMVLAHLSYAPLGGWNLNKVNLGSASIRGTSFRKTKMKKARLYRHLKI